MFLRREQVKRHTAVTSVSFWLMRGIGLHVQCLLCCFCDLSCVLIARLPYLWFLVSVERCLAPFYYCLDAVFFFLKMNLLSGASYTQRFHDLSVPLRHVLSAVGKILNITTPSMLRRRDSFCPVLFPPPPPPLGAFLNVVFITQP